MLSRVSYFLCTAILLYAGLIFYPKWKANGSESSFGWDVSGYYWYLPATLIYKDLKQQKFGDSIVSKYDITPRFDQSFVDKSGNRVMVYSSGMAVLYLPFFLIAHAVAEPLGYIPDGFSPPYQFVLQMGGLLVCLLGVWNFRKFLLLYYYDKVVAIVLLLLVLGTTYLNYAAIESLLTHNWLFTLYVFLLLATHRFYQRPSFKYAIAIGLLCGLAILARPSEIICLLLPLLWGLQSISTVAFKKHISFLRLHLRYIIITGLCIAAIGSVQVIYWLYITGRPLVYSYQEKGFSWLSPHLYNYMLSSRSGWLLYTPVMFFAFIGIVPFIKNGRNQVAVLAFFALNLYIVSAWDIWWYAGTGGRAMIQSYPILMMPVASLVAAALKTPLRRWAFAATALIFSYVNIWLVYSAHTTGGLYDSEAMTDAYFLRVVGRYSVPKEVMKLKDTDELYNGDPQQVRVLYNNNFDTARLPADMQPIKGAGSLLIQPRAAVTICNVHGWLQNADWIRVNATYHSFNKEWGIWNMCKLVVKFSKEGSFIRERSLKLHHILDEYTTQPLYFDVSLPDEPFDRIEIFYMNTDSDVKILADDISVVAFRS